MFHYNTAVVPARMLGWTYRSRRSLEGRALAMVVSVWASISNAQCPADPVAAQLKQQGDGAIDAGEYATAFGAYAKSLGIESCPAVYYNRGRALQGLGRNAEALDDFEQFRESAPTEVIANVPRLDEMMRFVREQVAEIAVDCDVRSASLRVDQLVFELPLKRPLRLDPGTVEVQVTAANYEPFRTRITLRAGEHRELTPRLVPRDSTGTLVVNSPTLGAIATVDGKTVGMVPVELRLEPGTHTVALRRADFEPASTRVEIRTSERRSVHLALEESTGWYGHWWFWTGVGVVAVTGVALSVALLTEQPPGSGDIPPGRIKMPLVAW
ncbi:MAG TPA: PEGA domain-containing protein [Polyangiaceae bacterium]|nr:PEGA domain-containing protein [Polyangiaceae bacterium]